MARARRDAATVDDAPVEQVETLDPMLDPDVPADSVVATGAHDVRDFDFERYVASGRPMYLRADAVELRRAEAAKAAASTQSEA
jgi:hypothetical protein